MARPKALARVAVEKFVEEEEIVPVRVIGKPRFTAVAGAAAGGVGQEDAEQTATQFVGHLRERHHHAAAGGALDFKFVAVVEVIPLDRFDQQVIQRKPDRPAPIAIAAEEVRLAVAGLVFERPLFAIERELVRLLVRLAHRAHAVRREEFILIQNVFENTRQPFLIGDGEHEQMIFTAFVDADVFA